MKVFVVLGLCGLLGGCVSGTDAGCIRYGANRAEMPRPLPEDALGRWVAVLDADMTATCR